MSKQEEPFVIYRMEDGSPIDEYEWVTSLEWFDERSREVRLIQRTYALISEEVIILPDPYPIEDDEDNYVICRCGKEFPTMAELEAHFHEHDD